MQTLRLARTAIGASDSYKKLTLRSSPEALAASQARMTALPSSSAPTPPLSLHKRPNPRKVTTTYVCTTGNHGICPHCRLRDNAPVGRADGLHCAGFQRFLAHQLHLGIRVEAESIDAHDRLDAKLDLGGSKSRQ